VHATQLRGIERDYRARLLDEPAQLVASAAEQAQRSAEVIAHMLNPLDRRSHGDGADARSAVTQRRQAELNASGPNRWAARAVAPALPQRNEAQRQSKERHLMPTTEDVKTRQGHEARGSDGDKLASDRFDRVERRRFPALLALGGGLGAVVVIVAFSRDDADHSDSVPKQPATRSRPLGDTPEAHDELNPHDVPLYSPARRAAEQQAGGLAGTTRGHRQGAARGRGRPAAGDELVGPDEKDEAKL
jgi:hypothetical protein